MNTIRQNKLIHLIDSSCSWVNGFHLRFNQFRKYFFKFWFYVKLWFERHMKHQSLYKYMNLKIISIERHTTSSITMTSKKQKIVNVENEAGSEVAPIDDDESLSTARNSSLTIEKNVLDLTTKLNELNDVVKKVYKMQKRASDPTRVSFG